MTEVEKYKLSLYETVCMMKTTKDVKIELVKYSVDGKKYIKKTYHSDMRKVFKLLSSVESVCLPKVYEVFFDEDTIVIEQYVEGELLESLISKDAPFNKQQITEIFVNLLAAMNVLHKHGVVHRDIKPGNIMITREGKAVLIDFGISRIFSLENERDTELYGTMGYAAPEQYGFSQSDCRSDIYSFGVTMKQVLNNRNVSKEITKIVNCCTEFDPLKRPQNVDEIKKYYDRIQRKRKISGWIVLFGGVIAVGMLTKNFKNELRVELETSKIVRMEFEKDYPCCIRLREGEEIQFDFKEKGVKNYLAAKLEENKLEIVLNQSEKFLFEYELEGYAESYPGGEYLAEIIWHDFDGNGIKEILPVITNAVVLDDSEGSLLRNGTMGWCLCTEDGKTYQMAQGSMETIVDPIQIFENIPDCIWGDFLKCYKLENGSLVLCD